MSSLARHRAAVVFDMDGVLTDTASVHAAAWKVLFDQFLERDSAPQEQFDIDADYRDFVDGRSREDGIRAFLASREITIPEGVATDALGARTVLGLAKRKQGLFDAELERHGVAVFPDALNLLQRLTDDDVPTALVTSSRNSHAVLLAAGLDEVFTLVVDGSDALRLGLPGKPHPATFLHAAERLGVNPKECTVLEDATSGVEAAVAGGFGMVIGVSRGDERERLLDAGAHLVVDDLAQLDSAPSRGETEASWCGGAKQETDGWSLTYDHFDPNEEGTREALCTLGNGYWATRGSIPGTVANSVHSPGTYLAGVFNRLITSRPGGDVETEHLVNAPDWTHVRLYTSAGQPLPLTGPGVIDYRQELNLRRGLLTRRVRVKDDAGRITTVTTEQFQSMAQPHLAALRMTLEAENWDGELLVDPAINAQVRNQNVQADAELSNEHFAGIESRRLDAETELVEVLTSQSQVTIAMAARTHVGHPPHDTQLFGGMRTIHLRSGHPVLLDRTVAVASSRDRALSTPALSVAKRIGRAADFPALLVDHSSRWDELWAGFGISVMAPERTSLALNLHTFHVLQSVAAVDPDLDAGVPARGLHGEGYRGHIFWDELFIYPLLTLRRPALTRSLLLYRYRRLDEARAAAQQHGFSGALFPWQSGSSGREETPTELFNTLNGEWMPDNSRKQRHVGLAVAYSVWQYYQMTRDIEFLTTVGAEILIEVARLFVSMASYDADADRFSIDGVMGPDEFHDGYPGAPGTGLRDNTYTNVMTAWLLTQTAIALDILPHDDRQSVSRRLKLTDEEIENWEHVSRRLTIPFHMDGVISQFSGYEQLPEFPWEPYRQRYGNIGRLDLILQAEGDNMNNYRLSKQADVLMLFYLFSAEELRETFERMGYALSADTIKRTVDFYLTRSSHGSTLSRVVHSWVLARKSRAESWELFLEALESDLSDTQGGTTREGVHLGAMAGTADMVIRCFGGIETRGDTLLLHPRLPHELPSVAFHIRYRDQPIDVEITQEAVSLQLHHCVTEPIQVSVEGIIKRLGPGEHWTQPLAHGLRKS